MADNDWLNTVVRQHSDGKFVQQDMPANASQAWQQAAKQCGVDLPTFTSFVA